jgi:hypothetical protein
VAQEFSDAGANAVSRVWHVTSKNDVDALYEYAFVEVRQIDVSIQNAACVITIAKDQQP